MIFIRKRNVIVLFSLVILFVFYSIFFSYDHLDSFDSEDFSSSTTGDLFLIKEDKELPELRVSNEKLKSEIERLQEHIFFLEQQLLLCPYPQQKDQPNSEDISSESKTGIDKKQSTLYEYEGDLEAYSAFTNINYFPVDRPLYNRQVLKITGSQKANIESILSTALRHLNKYKSNKYELSDFQMGFERASSINGFNYELFFKNSNYSEYIRLARPLQPLRFSNRFKPKPKEVINFVLPLSMEQKNLNAFKYFLAMFELVALKKDNEQSTLTVIFSYKNQAGLVFFQDIQKASNHFQDRTGFNKITLIKIKEKQFSRAHLLQVGSQSCCTNTTNNLMFFCDVDVMFNQNFLDLCRLNARMSEQVYFPILYSYYNPALSKAFDKRATSLETTLDRIHSKNETAFTADDIGKLDLVISDEVGTWRTSGFGMSCLYQQDFESIGGFGDYVEKSVWGGEDLYLIRKFLKSKLRIFRAVTPGLFHLYHQKQCDQLKMTEKQYGECIMVKISNEASLKGLGRLHFND